VVGVLGSRRRDARAAKQFFTAAIALTGTEPTEVMTDRARIYPGVPDVILRGAFHNVAQYANKRCRGRSQAAEGRLRPMIGLGFATRDLGVGPPCRAKRRVPNDDASKASQLHTCYGSVSCSAPLRTGPLDHAGERSCRGTP
jgi:hypothetical protein